MPRRTSSRTRTARATTSTGWSPGRQARGRRSTSRPAAGMSRRGSGRRGSRSSHATPRPGCVRTSSAAPRTLPFADAASTSSRAGPRRTTSPTSARRSREMARVSGDRVLTRRHAEHGRRGRGGRGAPRSVSRAQLHRGRVARLRRGGGARDRRASRFFAHTFDLAAWLERTGCEGDEAERADRAPRRARPATAG